MKIKVHKDKNGEETMRGEKNRTGANRERKGKERERESTCSKGRAKQ